MFVLTECPEVLVSLFMRSLLIFEKKILEVLVTSSVCLHEKRSKSLLRCLYIHAGSHVSCCFTPTLTFFTTLIKDKENPNPN